MVTKAIRRPGSSTRRGGYETWRTRSRYLEVDAAAKITAKVLEMVAELKSTVSSQATP